MSSASGVVDEVPVDDVGDPPRESAEGFFAGLALCDLAVEVDPARGVRVADLGDGDRVDRPVQLAVAAQVDPVPWPRPGGGFVGGGGVVGGVVIPCGEPFDAPMFVKPPGEDGWCGVVIG